jgi:hypothetical protein
VTAEQKTPHCLSGRKYLDLSNDEEVERKITSLLHEIHGVPERPKPKMGPNPFPGAAQSDVDCFDSTVFFSDRFRRAFPGVRGIAWFREPQVALQRLQIFFQEPISSRKSSPIWWWRGGNSPIGSVHISPPDAVYLDDQELLIEEVAAVNTRGYFRQFLYIKTRSSAPSGLALSKTKTALLETGAYVIDQEGDAYVIEEFGLFRGRPITLAEYDDGSAVIDGQVVDVSKEAIRRVRYLTAYNMIVAAKFSPINNSTFDDTLARCLDDILRGSAELGGLVEAIMRLPRHPKDD